MNYGIAPRETSCFSKAHDMCTFMMYMMCTCRFATYILSITGMVIAAMEFLAVKQDVESVGLINLLRAYELCLLLIYAS